VAGFPGRRFAFAPVLVFTLTLAFDLAFVRALLFRPGASRHNPPHSPAFDRLLHARNGGCRTDDSAVVAGEANLARIGPFPAKGIFPAVGFHARASRCCRLPRASNSAPATLRLRAGLKKQK